MNHVNAIKKHIKVNPVPKQYDITCCYKCNNRSVGCHAICDIYISQKSIRDDFVRNKPNDRLIMSYEVDKYIKLNRSR